MTTLVMSIVSRSTGTAQLFFLIAVILAAIAVIVGFAHRPEPWWPYMWAPVMLFISLGLLFAF
jgi:hypothetical protein